MTNLSVSKAHKLFRKLLPKRRFGIIIGNRHPFGVLSLSISPTTHRPSFLAAALLGSRERKRLKERCREYRSHSILGLL